jgi:hypothetical protein
VVLVVAVLVVGVAVLVQWLVLQTLAVAVVVMVNLKEILLLVDLELPLFVTLHQLNRIFLWHITQK